jgi:hypothetical protein
MPLLESIPTCCRQQVVRTARKGAPLRPAVSHGVAQDTQMRLKIVQRIQKDARGLVGIAPVQRNLTEIGGVLQIVNTVGCGPVNQGSYVFMRFPCRAPHTHVE